MFDIFKIFSFLKKTFSRKDVLLIIFLIGLYFLTRLINLDKFPIFSDEGIYIRWAKIAWHDASWRFISLTDGKQPLQTWGTIPFLKLFPDNALLAGRLFGVASGFFALLGVFLISFCLFGKITAYFASFLYIITPFYLFFDRMALVDSFVNASYIWMLFLSIIMVKTLRLDIALIYGVFSGIFLLAKSSVSLFLGTSFFGFVLIFKKTKNRVKNIINYLFLFFTASALAIIIYNIQRLSPYLHYVALKNQGFVMTIQEFLRSPFVLFWHNFRYIPYYIAHELGYMTFILGLIGLCLIFKKDKILGLYLSLWIVIPYGAMTFFMKLLSIRYTIFLSILFIIFTSYFFNQLFIKKIKKIKLLVLLILTGYLFTFYFSYTILFDFKNIPFPPLPAPSVDRGQYLEGWPAGWGIKEFMDFARVQSLKKPVVIIAEGNFGMAGDVLDVFLKRTDKDKITIKSYWPLGEEQLKENIHLLKNNYVYAFFSHQKTFPNFWPLKHLKTITKPGGQSAFHIFEIVSNK